MTRLGMASMAAAARSYAAQRPEKPKVTAGQIMKLGLAGATVGGTIGKDIAIRKGLPKKDPRTGGEVLGARDATQAAAEQKMPGASQEAYERWGHAGGTVFGIMSGLFS